MTEKRVAHQYIKRRVFKIVSNFNTNQFQNKFLQAKTKTIETETIEREVIEIGLYILVLPEKELLNLKKLDTTSLQLRLIDRSVSKNADQFYPRMVMSTVTDNVSSTHHFIQFRRNLVLRIFFFTIKRSSFSRMMVIQSHSHRAVFYGV